MAPTIFSPRPSVHWIEGKLKSQLAWPALLLAASILVMGFLAVAEAAPSPSVTVFPESGPVGTEITITGQGFTPGSELGLLWSTVDGRWVLPPPARGPQGPEDPEHPAPGGTVDNSLIFHGHDFRGSEFSPRAEVLSSVTADTSGAFSTRIKAPFDYGGRHWITAVAWDEDAEPPKGAFTLLPSFTVSPSEGPPGTAVIIRASGLGYGLYSTNYHVLWDNRYVGYASAITTRGNATVTIYAVGDPGKHFIDIYEGYPGPAYLNIQEAPPNPQYYTPPLIPFHTEFTITGVTDAGPDKTRETLALGSLALILGAAVVTPLAGRRSAGLRGLGRRVLILALILGIGLATMAAFSGGSAVASKEVQPKSTEIRPEIFLPKEVTSGDSPSQGLPAVSASPPIATVGSAVTLSGGGFTPGANVELVWGTKKGSYLRGWDDVIQPLGTATADSQGSFTFTLTVPHDLEGPHPISARAQNTNATGALYITRSATITPTTGPSGTSIEIQMTGVGWTFVTNTATIVYDNAFVGYACGFNSLGNVTITLPAVGKPGIHTIDIYPSIYDGPAQGKGNSIYRYPLLTPEDHPARSPAFHLEFLITEPEEPDNGAILTPQSVSLATIVVGVASLALQARPARGNGAGRNV